MTIRKVFVDKRGCQLECYINRDNNLYIGINTDDGAEEYTVFDIADLRELIRELVRYREEMEIISHEEMLYGGMEETIKDIQILPPEKEVKAC